MSGVDEVAEIGESAEEFTEKNRLKSLFDAKDRARDAIREAPLKEYEARRQAVDPQTIDEHVRSAVAAYVLECEALFQNTEKGQEYWHEYQFTPITLPQSAPRSIQTDTFGPDVKGMDIIGIPDSMINENQQIEVVGIGSYISLPSPIKMQWVGFASDGCLSRGSNQNVVTQTIGVPRFLSEDVFRATNKLLADLGIGIDAEKIENGEVSFDYSDLI